MKSDSNITIKEVISSDELKKFVMFPHTLYKDSKYWVAPIIKEELEVLNKETVIEALKEVYDPEIPVNVVDLGLIYNVEVEDNEVHVEMTLTAQGCGMGPYIAQQAEWRIAEIEDVEDVVVDLVFEPPWNPELITEDGKRLLGID